MRTRFIVIVLALGTPAFAGSTSRTHLVSEPSPRGFVAHQPAVSHDGRWVVFDVEGRESDVGIRHRNQGVWHANRDGLRWKVGTPEGNRGHHPDISADGQWIVYVTDARLSPQDNNYVEDVYVWRARDTYHNSLELISCGIRGGAGDGQVYGPARISADGRYVAWTSHATNYVDIGGDPDGPVGSIFVRDRTFGRTTRIPVTPAYEGAGTHIENIDFQFTEDGQFQVAFETAAALVRDDTNGKKDVYVVTADPPVFALGGNRHAFRQHSPEHAGDKALWSVELVSVGPDGALGDSDSFGAHILQPSTNRAAAEFGGRPLVVFTSNARTLSIREGDFDPDVFVQAFDPSWTGLGPLPPRQLTSNLSPQEKSRCQAGDAENLASGDIGIAMTCRGPLVREDVNHIGDVYVQTLSGGPILASRPDPEMTPKSWTHGPPKNQRGSAPSSQPNLSGDGCHVAFASEARNLSNEYDNDPHTEIFSRYNPFGWSKGEMRIWCGWSPRDP